jgi:hypothetical protein
MAATFKEHVIISSTDGDTYTGQVRVKGVKVVGGAGGATVNLKSGAVTGGTILYSTTVGNSAEKFEEVKFRSKDGLYINISAGSGTVYIYIE